MSAKCINVKHGFDRCCFVNAFLNALRIVHLNLQFYLEFNATFLL